MLRKVNAEPASRGLLVVANQKEHTVLVVDPDERRELAKVVVGVNGHEVMVSKDGRFAYVPIYGDSGVGKPGSNGSTIDVIDIAVTPTRRTAAHSGDLPPQGGGQREDSPAFGFPCPVSPAVSLTALAGGSTTSRNRLPSW